LSSNASGDLQKPLLEAEHVRLNKLFAQVPRRMSLFPRAPWGGGGCCVLTAVLSRAWLGTQVSHREADAALAPAPLAWGGGNRASCSRGRCWCVTTTDDTLELPRANWN